MTVLALLGKSLKSDEVMSLLELHDVDVIYEFDRLHENSADLYWAPLRAAGLQLRFNDQQVLDTIFCYVESREGFSQTAVSAIGVPIFTSRQQAETSLRASGARYTPSPSPQFDWVRSLGPPHDVHYEFKNGQLAMVTLMLTESV